MEFRQNIATREWVLFALDREKRPEEFRAAETPWTHKRPAWRVDCPFCPGNEVHTPGETRRISDPLSGAWMARSFPNGYPAVSPEASVDRHGDPFHHAMGAIGLHEVIAESRIHNTTLALQPIPEIRMVLEVWRDRVQAMRARTDAEHVVIYKNHGSTAGTSLEHPHSQIVSLPVTPWQVRYRMEEAMRYYDDHGECVFCRMLAVETADASRIVVQGEHFVGFIPYAAYSPFSVWLLPRRHRGCLSRADDDELDELATHLHTLLAALYDGLHDPPYNLVVRAANRDLVEARFFHWYIAVVPRLQKSAGFEMGTGMFINTRLPERDAHFLREAGKGAGATAPASPLSP